MGKAWKLLVKMGKVRSATWVASGFTHQTNPSKTRGFKYGAKTLSIITFIIKGLLVVLSINVTEHNSTL